MNATSSPMTKASSNAPQAGKDARPRRIGTRGGGPDRMAQGPATRLLAARLHRVDQARPHTRASPALSCPNWAT